MSFYKVGISKKELSEMANETLEDAKKYTDDKIESIPQTDLSHLQTKEDAAVDLSAAKAYTDNKTKDLETVIGAQLKVDTHANKKDNPHGVTKTQVGLGNVEDIKQASKVEFNSHASNSDIHVTAGEKSVWSAKETPEGAQIKATKALTDAKLYTDAEIKKIVIPEVSGFETKEGAQARVDEHANNILNPHKVTKAQVGLSNVTNEKQATETQHQQHLDDKANPHNVTKSQVGLASVLNYGVATQAEAETGTSNAKYMTPLRTKQSVDVATKVVDNKLEAHKSDTSNPHAVTKAQVGLTKVDNVKQMPITGGTFTGVAKARNNTSYTTAQLRNVIAVSSGTDISKLGNNGDIIIVYE